MKKRSPLKRWFFTGLILLVPIMVTIYLFVGIVRSMDGLIGLIPAAMQPDQLLGFHIPGLGVLFTFVIVLVTGMVGTSFIGRWLVGIGENMLERIPLVRTVYGALKNVLETVLRDNQDSFRRVVLIEYPRKGTYALGFVSGTGHGEVQGLTKDEVITVFVPTSPNPTSGFLLYVPEKDTTPLTMTVEDGMKCVISAGVITPNWTPPAK
ncbi:MAG: hypothetical protein COW19_10590 [Zetaproteobacteria bacterium CG12_big_fil_rev_8_21_14_0_65_55_1124]|nr:MAG: hypothetical protein AUJ58_04870 [Zetaproteobacteria bacterium CG1_02_55_237]PIS19643.1 MAG: hypothetical protein COT53_04605 [Zetaproteobacteria bacterium CG08_land_8_20_14_0_20_55_17]PIW41985.1 MAG: hypothetical protein COW19_10590 [Zetaproteobacteria bacterium CG12_big_fil_rev_8_21_14_0_65_55_1124]PIY53873.1 MAG: hypothetical protein COZ01_02415 [Zetaproteobacteria bacterium CG_4_10_14_0_8_um_filter_55_43]PIZ37041.1 MAG: hypothetical protein COY36_10425 [Zetaproteobacteria bacterium 